VSIDFFTVPTVTLGVLFGFIVLEHRRREVLHFITVMNALLRNDSSSPFLAKEARRSQ